MRTKRRLMVSGLACALIMAAAASGQARPAVHHRVHHASHSRPPGVPYYSDEFYGGTAFGYFGDPHYGYYRGYY